MLRKLSWPTFLVFWASALWASQISLIPFEKVAAKANAIVHAEITKVDVQKRRCSTTRSFELKVKRVLKGEVRHGQKLAFRYTDFHMHRAEWFWQDDCLSVSYFVPPLAKNMKKGQQVKAALLVKEAGIEVLGVNDLYEVKN